MIWEPKIHYLEAFQVVRCVGLQLFIEYLGFMSICHLDVSGLRELDVWEKIVNPEF